MVFASGASSKSPTMDPRLFNLEEYARKLSEAWCVMNNVPVTRRYTDEELAGPIREVEAAKRELSA